MVRWVLIYISSIGLSNYLVYIGQKLYVSIKLDGGNFK